MEHRTLSPTRTIVALSHVEAIFTSSFFTFYFFLFLFILFLMYTVQNVYNNIYEDSRRPGWLTRIWLVRWMERDMERIDRRYAQWDRAF